MECYAPSTRTFCKSPSLERRRWFVMLFGLLLALTCRSALSQTSGPDEARAVNSPQVVVLTNGSILQGFVEKRPLHITLQTQSGSRIVLKRERVAFISDSLSHAYWDKLARIRASHVAAHVQLFHWCLKHQLIPEAGNQIDVLITTDIGSNQLSHLSQLYRERVRELSSAETKPAQGNASAAWQAPVVHVHKASATREVTSSEPVQQASFLGDEGQNDSTRIRSVRQAGWSAPQTPNSALRPKPAKLEPLSQPARKIPSLKGRSFRGFVPADPYDPEIFNRRQAAKKAAKAP